jgi:hypothetical protein
MRARHKIEAARYFPLFRVTSKAELAVAAVWLAAIAEGAPDDLERGAKRLAAEVDRARGVLHDRPRLCDRYLRNTEREGVVRCALPDGHNGDCSERRTR